MTFTSASRRPRASVGGFTLVEIMIVVTIIGLLAAIAVPVWTKVRRHSKGTAFINDLRVGLYAAQTCLMETGEWPPDSGPGVPPPELVPYVSTSTWDRETPVGGNWDWDKDQVAFGCKAGLSVYIDTATADQILLQEIDSRIDDGNLATGRFHIRAHGYIYALEDL